MNNKGVSEAFNRLTSHKLLLFIMLDFDPELDLKET